jgi:hypothetical protein
MLRLVTGAVAPGVPDTGTGAAPVAARAHGPVADDAAGGNVHRLVPPSDRDRHDGNAAWSVHADILARDGAA